MLLNVWRRHIILTFISQIHYVNTCGTFKWHFNIGNTYCLGLWIIQILIVDMWQMLKLLHMVHMVEMVQMVHIYFMVYEAHFPILQMVHISMGLVFKMCTHVYTFVIFKYFHVHVHFNLPHKNIYNYLYKFTCIPLSHDLCMIHTYL